MTNVALTVIGEDRPGLVSALAAVVGDHGGNWLDSKMARLAGQFAGVALVDIPDDRLFEFEDALGLACSSSGLEVLVRRTGAGAADGTKLAMSLVGQDRPGIVRLVSQTLAGIGVTIDDLQTSTCDAPWGGGTLFQAEAAIRMPAAVDEDTVRTALESLANELMVDLEVAQAS